MSVEQALAQFSQSAASVHRKPDELTAVMSELNRTPGTNTDEQQARALKRILAARGLRIVEAGRG